MGEVLFGSGVGRVSDVSFSELIEFFLRVYNWLSVFSCGNFFFRRFGFLRVEAVYRLILCAGFF